MSAECVAIFWLVNASTGEKSCLQFSILTGSGAAGEGGVSHSLKATETMCQAFYHLLRSIKTRFTQGRLFYTQGPFFCALGPLFCALVREEAIFAVCKRCANEGFACMCKENIFFPDLFAKFSPFLAIFFNNFNVVGGGGVIHPIELLCN